MSEKPTPIKAHPEPELYEIRVRGHLDARWASQFECLTITLEEDGNTLLTGPVIDQAALHGLLKKVRDLGLSLVSVSQVQFNETHQYRSAKGEKMNIKKLVVEFVIVFVVTLVTTAIVTFLWNIIGDGASAVDWETSFRFAIIFGIILTWGKSREIKEK